MSELIVRRAEERDVDRIAELEIQCFTTPWTREAVYQDVVENKRALYIVAEVEGIVVGYAGIWSIIDEGHITNVAVAPEFRKLHIGSAIISVLLDVTQKAGVERHTLEVRRGNEAAIRLYEKYGFKVQGERKGYYEDTGEDALIMWREQNERRKVFDNGI